MSNFSTFFPAGGGGSGTIGAVSYFVPDPTATFVAGQEVYTDPADSSVWLRSGAILLGTGSGVLDASIYRDSEIVFAQLASPGTNPGTINSNRYSSSYIGNNKFIINTWSTNNYSQYNSVFDVSLGTFSVAALYSGVQLFDGQPGTANGSTGNVGTGNASFPGRGTYNSTHHFLMGNCNNIFSHVWREDPSGFFNIRYVPFTDTTNATSRSAYSNNALTFKSPFPAIALQNYSAGSIGQHLGIAITNPSSNERHWLIKEGSVVAEYTFNSAAANNTNPYTATGNSITIPFAWNYGGLNLDDYRRSMYSNGNSLYFLIADPPIDVASSVTTIYEYNATTRALINTTTINGIPAGNSKNIGTASIVPDANTGAGDQTWAITGPDSPIKAFLSTSQIKGPFTADATYPTVTAKTQRVAGTTFDAEQIYTNNDNELLYMWLKIA